MKIEEVISLVMTELNRAEDAHPDWPKMMSELKKKQKLSDSFLKSTWSLAL